MPELERRVTSGRRYGPADEAAFRVDFADWLTALPRGNGGRPSCSPRGSGRRSGPALAVRPGPSARPGGGWPILGLFQGTVARKPEGHRPHRPGLGVFRPGLPAPSAYATACAGFRQERRLILIRTSIAPVAVEVRRESRDSLTSRPSAGFEPGPSSPVGDEVLPIKPDHHPSRGCIIMIDPIQGRGPAGRAPQRPPGPRHPLLQPPGRAGTCIAPPGLRGRLLRQAFLFRVQRGRHERNLERSLRAGFPAP